jgi:hypothetical protein
VTVTVDATTSPSLSDLDGRVCRHDSPEVRRRRDAHHPRNPEDRRRRDDEPRLDHDRLRRRGLHDQELSEDQPRGAGENHGRRRKRVAAVLLGQRALPDCDAAADRHRAPPRSPPGAITAGGTIRKVVIGQLKVTLAAGQSKVVRLSLNPAGKRLLKSHRSFKARLLVVRAENTIVKARTVTITRKTKG